MGFLAGLEVKTVLLAKQTPPHSLNTPLIIFFTGDIGCFFVGPRCQEAYPLIINVCYILSDLFWFASNLPPRNWSFRKKLAGFPMLFIHSSFDCSPFWGWGDDICLHWARHQHFLFASLENCTSWIARVSLLPSLMPYAVHFRLLRHRWFSSISNPQPVCHGDHPTAQHPQARQE